MKSYFYLLLTFSLITNEILAQSIVLIGGFTELKTKTIVPVINQDNDIDLKEKFGLRVQDLNINKYNNLKLNLNYYVYKGWSHFNIVSTGGWFGSGSTCTILHRFGTSFSYDLLKNKPKSKLSPYLGINLEVAETTCSLFTQRGLITENDHDKYRGKLFLELTPRNQIVPIVGINYSWNFLWRLNLNFDYHFVYGYRSFQRYYFEYEYEGIEQPTAEFVSDGTGHFFSIGLGFDVSKREKRQK